MNMNMNMNGKGNVNGAGGGKPKKGFKNLISLNVKKYIYLIGQTLIVFVALFFINFAAKFLSRKVDFKIDLNHDKVCSLSPQVRTYLKNYDKKIKFLYCGNNYMYSHLTKISNVLDELRNSFFAANPKFEVEQLYSLEKLQEKIKDVEMLDFMGPLMHKRPFRGLYIIDETDPAKRRGIYVPEEQLWCEGAVDFSFKDVISTNAASHVRPKVHIEASAIERSFVGALEKLADSSLIRVSATTGHGEHDFSMNTPFFNTIGAKLEKVNLTKGELSPEKQLLLIAAPRTDFSTEELARVEEFLNAGGKLIYFASAGQKKLEKLEGFFDDHGIEFSEGCVVSVETDKPDIMIGIDLNAQENNSNNPYVENMVDRNLSLMLGGCRPMKLHTPAGGWQAFEICKTPKNCTVVTKDSAKNIEEIKNAPKSEYIAAVGVQKELGSEKTAKIVAVSCVNVLNGAFTSALGQPKNDMFEQEESKFMDCYLTSNSNFIYSLLKETSGQKTIDYIPIKTVKSSMGVSDSYDSDGQRLSKEQYMVRTRLINGTRWTVAFVFLLLWVVCVTLRRKKNK